MNNKSFNIQGHMDSEKICILFQGVDSSVLAFWKHIPDTHMQDKHASLVLRCRSIFLTYVVMFKSLTTSFYMHLRHMAAICIKFWEFPPLPLYICFGESPWVLPSCSSLYLYNNAGCFRPAAWAWVQHKVCKHMKPLICTFKMFLPYNALRCPHPHLQK